MRDEQGNDIRLVKRGIPQQGLGNKAQGWGDGYLEGDHTEPTGSIGEPTERGVEESQGVPNLGQDQAMGVQVSRRRQKAMKWAYGVTTIPVRRNTFLPRTLASLRSAGFDQPTLFVDDNKDVAGWESQFNLQVVTRSYKVRTYGNWVLAMWELLIRFPEAERYAMFQDDFVTYRNLRGYLEKCHYPRKQGYWNLYTFPKNQELSITREGNEIHGWYESNQRGLGAVALIFDRDAVLDLLQHSHMIGRPLNADRGWRAVDGGIVTAMGKAGYKEYVHNPSLVQHIGDISSMQNRKHPLATSFRGENYDATELIQK